MKTNCEDELYPLTQRSVSDPEPLNAEKTRDLAKNRVSDISLPWHCGSRVRAQSTDSRDHHARMHGTIALSNSIRPILEYNSFAELNGTVQKESCHGPRSHWHRRSWGGEVAVDGNLFGSVSPSARQNSGVEPRISEGWNGDTKCFPKKKHTSIQQADEKSHPESGVSPKSSQRCALSSSHGCSRLCIRAICLRLGSSRTFCPTAEKKNQSGHPSYPHLRGSLLAMIKIPLVTPYLSTQRIQRVVFSSTRDESWEGEDKRTPHQQRFNLDAIDNDDVRDDGSENTSCLILSRTSSSPIRGSRALISGLESSDMSAKSATALWDRPASQDDEFSALLSLLHSDTEEAVCNEYRMDLAASKPDINTRETKCVVIVQSNEFVRKYFPDEAFSSDNEVSCLPNEDDSPSSDIEPGLDRSNQCDILSPAPPHHRGSNRHGRKKNQSLSKNEIIKEQDHDHLADTERSLITTGNLRYAKRRKKSEELLNELRLQLELEREVMVAQWKAEFNAEQDASRWHNRCKRWMVGKITSLTESVFLLLTSAEAFVSNLPLTIGAVGLAWVTMGVVWFKFAEENLDSCVPVHFHSARCTFPEFPGCFECDTKSVFYQIALYFHYTCTLVAGIIVAGFIAKLMVAWRVVGDELSNPATSTPCGVVCITILSVFAGHGKIGELVVLLTSAVHVCLSVWFLRMAIFKYHILPDPSWSPNTVGLGYAAIKTWLYYPRLGYILMALCAIYFFAIFFTSVVRVASNRKISATVCWIQMSAPSITLYCMTIMGQPLTEKTLENSPESMTRFQQMHHDVYLPLMHFMFLLALIGVCSSVQSLWVRWDGIREKEFSPAHVAFCFPTLSHANSIQAYRAAIDAYSTIPPGSPLKLALYSYWLVLLLAGTAVNVVISVKFFYNLPKWTRVDVAGEVEPPPPNETMIHDVLEEGTGDTMRQSFVSPAVLQANESGALVRVRRGTEDWRGPYVRTRQVTSHGFDPTMNWYEFNEEREALLEWVAENNPRQRTRTMSTPAWQLPYGTFDYAEMDNLSGIRGKATHKRSRTQI